MIEPRIRNGLIVAISIAFAIIAAVQIANEQYFAAVMATLGIGWIFSETRRGARPDAWMLAAAVFGYVLGNRGFAQIPVTPRFPLLFAEATLLVTVPALLFRAAMERKTPLARDALNYSIFVWMLLATVRLPVDLHEFGFVALRDFATAYYATLFFVGQAMARHEPSERLVRRGFQAAVVVLPVTFLLSNVATEAVFRIQVRGIPVFFYKEDLVAAAFFAGFFMLLSRPKTVRLPLWRWLTAALCYGSAFSIGSSRAAIAGLAVTLTWWGMGRRWRPFKLQAVIVPCGVVGLTAIALLRHQDFRHSRIYGLYEHLASIVDVTGSRKYANPDEQYEGDNNKFRLAWWRSVADETLEVNPLLGVGFGYDITTPFVRNYEFDLGEDFSTRSPHSIFMTVFGRMGILGLIAWLAVVGSAARQTWRAFHIGRHGADVSAAIGWWSVVWVYLTSACFGVVLEGPMGAVVFWTALGMANASTKKAAAEAVAANATIEPAPAQVPAA